MEPIKGGEATVRHLFLAPQDVYGFSDKVKIPA